MQTGQRGDHRAPGVTTTCSVYFLACKHTAASKGRKEQPNAKSAIQSTHTTHAACVPACMSLLWQPQIHSLPQSVLQAA